MENKCDSVCPPLGGGRLSDGVVNVVVGGSSGVWWLSRLPRSSAFLFSEWRRYTTQLPRERMFQRSLNACLP